MGVCSILEQVVLQAKSTKTISLIRLMGERVQKHGEVKEQKGRYHEKAMQRVLRKRQRRWGASSNHKQNIGNQKQHVTQHMTFKNKAYRS